MLLFTSALITNELISNYGSGAVSVRVLGGQRISSARCICTQKFPRSPISAFEIGFTIHISGREGEKKIPNVKIEIISET